MTRHYYSLSIFRISRMLHIETKNTAHVDNLLFQSTCNYRMQVLTSRAALDEEQQ